MTDLDTSITNLHKKLWNDCVKLHADISAFRYLFVDDAEAVAVMNATSPGFFLTFRSLLWNDMHLQLCRITDPVRTTGKQNSSISALRSIVNPQQQCLCKELIDDAEHATMFAREWRNKWLAHRDLETALSQAPDKRLPPSTIRGLSAAANAIGKALDCLDPAGAKTAWTPNDSANQAEVLVRYLREGHIAHRERLQAFEAGALEVSKLWSAPITN
jgi:hypothetical protein